MGTLNASLLGNMLAGKGILRAGYGIKGDYGTKEDGILRAGYGTQDFKCCVML